jgi:hypothetical protein
MSEAADQRVHDLLRDLERNAATPPPDLPESVVRTARWQSAVRNSLVISSELATVVGVALRLAAGTRKP